jgi:hypothetical protein
MKGPAWIALTLAVLVGVALWLRPVRPPRPRDGTESGGSPAALADGPFWPLAEGHRWVYRETSPDHPGEVEVSVVVTAETRGGFKLSEERDGRDVDTEIIEPHADGWYLLASESQIQPTLLLPADPAATRDWSQTAHGRAAVARNTEFTLADRTHAAFEVRYETMSERGGWLESHTLTFARGLGIVRKDSTRQPGTAPKKGRSSRVLWELVRFIPNRPEKN